MANYSNLKAAIEAAIKTNGNQEITGQVLQDVLTSIVSVIGANYTFAGVAKPSTNPGTPDQNEVYLVMEGGTYTNFNGMVLPAGISLLMWNGTWTSETVMYGDGGVFDISVYKSSGGTLATFADLSAALDGGNNIPASARKGGMSVKFVQSSENKYVKFFCMAQNFTTDVTQWQGVDDEPTAGSDNLVKSGGVKYILGDICEKTYTFDGSGSLDTGVTWMPIPTIKAGTTINISVDCPSSFVNVLLYKTSSILSKVFDSIIASGATASITLSDDISYGRLYLTSSAAVAGDYKLKISYGIEGVLDKQEKDISDKSLEISSINNHIGKEDSKTYQHTGGKIDTGITWFETNLKKGDDVSLYLESPEYATTVEVLLYKTDSIHSQVTSKLIARGVEFIIKNLSDDVNFIRMYRNNSPAGDYTLHIKNGIIEEISSIKSYKHKVLWLGTSIPSACNYPDFACAKLDYICYNEALGASTITKPNAIEPYSLDAGKALSESSAEKAIRFAAWETGTAEEQAQYARMMNWGYDKQIIPYIDGTIDSCDIVVFDHGVNDRRSSWATVIQDFDSVDTSIDRQDADYDRGDYVDAFCFLLHKIWGINPNIKICITSFLENLTGSPSYPNDVQGRMGYLVSEINKKIAERFDIQYLNMCDYNGFTLEFIPNTSNYISNINQMFGTNYQVLNFTGKTNPDGNVCGYQYFCPDGLHPHTDKSGRSLKRLVTTFVRLLRDI